MSDSDPLAYLKRREALSRAYLRNARHDLTARVLGDPKTPSGAVSPGRALGSSILPLGLAAGAGYLLVPRRRPKGPVAQRRLASAGWLLAAGRFASTISRLMPT